MKTTYYLRKSLFCLLLFASFASISKADYPLFWQRYTADPWGIEYNGRLYLFCSHDTYSPQRGYGYFMNDITCISTDDLKNWTDHGEVFQRLKMGSPIDLGAMRCLSQQPILSLLR